MLSACVRAGCGLLKRLTLRNGLGETDGTENVSQGVRACVLCRPLAAGHSIRTRILCIELFERLPATATVDAGPRRDAPIVSQYTQYFFEFASHIYCVRNLRRTLGSVPVSLLRGPRRTEGT